MDKNTRIFEDHSYLTLEIITKKINEIVRENTSVIQENEDILKWTSLPQVILNNEDNQNQFIEVVKYIDELMMSIEKKIQLINTVAAMLDFGNISISKLEINSLFLLADYFKNITTKNYQEEFQLLGNDELLESIRRNVLDLEKRNSLIAYIVEQARKANINFSDSNAVNLFLKKVISVLKDKNADEILGIENYMNGEISTAIDFQNIVTK